MCSMCKEVEKEVSGKCRPCYNKYMNAYVKNRYYRIRNEWISKLGGECVGCASKENLEFDHIEEKDKAYDISKILSSHSKAKIESEMTKCQILCQECHKEKTINFNSVGHGQGLTGKKNCYCDLCAPLKRQYAYDKGYRKPRKQYVCGEYRTYQHGCKCNKCKTANTEYMKDFYKRNSRKK